MEQKIIKKARIKFNQLSQRYNGFINVIVDDWRGYRFIFDTKDVRKCKNKCEQCPLYLLLKDEKSSLFSAGLYPASKKDKEIFGPQNFLNCKTIKQYQTCYLDFITKKIKSTDELKKESKLVNNLGFIYSANGQKKKIEQKFKKKIFNFVATTKVLNNFAKK
ncbi:MAG: hypothetical protein WC508_02965 [Patescibacteria group bacterium]